MPVTGPLLPDDLDPVGYVGDLSESNAGAQAIDHVRAIIELQLPGHQQEAVLGLLASAWNVSGESVLDAIQNVGPR